MAEGPNPPPTLTDAVLILNLQRSAIRVCFAGPQLRMIMAVLIAMTGARDRREISRPAEAISRSRASASAKAFAARICRRDRYGEQ